MHRLTLEVSRAWLASVHNISGSAQAQARNFCKPKWPFGLLPLHLGFIYIDLLRKGFRKDALQREVVPPQGGYFSSGA